VRPLSAASNARAALLVGALALGTAAAAAAATAAIAVGMARRVVTPAVRREEDVAILAADVDAGWIRLARTPDTVVPGRYGLWFAGGSGHARVGRVLTMTPTTVTRLLESVQIGRLEDARRGRWGAWYHLVPADLGLDADELDVMTELGPAPAWVVHPATGPSTDWVIQVHGRGVTRSEGLRALPVFRRAGYSSLLISYRNDGLAPPSADRRYALGLEEWRDVESAVAEAMRRGARRIVIMGWSMGGAIALQFLTRSPLARHVIGAVLESPVVDWRTVLRFHAALSGLPRPVGEIALGVLGSAGARPLLGTGAPIDLRELDLVARADELAVPLLLLHSDDDGYVPAEASLALAAARPDIVTLERFAVARHTKLWNVDPVRWEAVIGRWLRARGQEDAGTLDQRA
jgi:alpha-beta hydrolase superfamily lysophospholipase